MKGMETAMKKIRQASCAILEILKTLWGLCAESRKGRKPVIKKISQENCAILKIAHLISMLDGNISKEELDLLLDTGEKVSSDDFSDTSEFLLVPPIPINKAWDEILISGGKMMRLQSLYKTDDYTTEDEILQAFLDEVETDFFNRILERGSFRLTKKAFAIWIAMAMSDHKYNDIERLAIRKLQEKANEVTEKEEEKITDVFLECMERKFKVIEAIDIQMGVYEDCRKKILKKIRAVLGRRGVCEDYRKKFLKKIRAVGGSRGDREDDRKKFLEKIRAVLGNRGVREDYKKKFLEKIRTVWRRRGDRENDRMTFLEKSRQEVILSLHRFITEE